MSLRTPLSRARGHGSAHEGAQHWIVQRGTAIALVPLTLFFLSTCIALVGADYETAKAYVAQPLIAMCRSWNTEDWPCWSCWMDW